MKIIETIKRHANIALALGVMLSMIAAQAIPVFASPSVSAEDAAEAADDELPADNVPLSALQPQAA